MIISIISSLAAGSFILDRFDLHADFNIKLCRDFPLLLSFCL